MDFFDFSGKFIIKIIIDSAELRSKSRIKFSKTCEKFVGGFNINFRGKIAEDVFDFRCIIFCSKIIDDSIPVNNAEPMNKKTAVKTKKGMLPEELNNAKLDMIR